MRKFICKEGASNYYLVSSGMGGFLNPPGHPEHAYSIVECRGGHEVGSYSLSSAAKESYLPARVKGTARGVLKRWNPGVPDESWLASVYNYFRHCYSRDGIGRNINNNETVTYGKFWGNAELEQYENPAHHLGYLHVKSFYPDHTPDLKRIQENDPAGRWSNA